MKLCACVVLLAGGISLAFLAGGKQLLAQGPAGEQHAFEVASIRPHENAEDPSATNFLPGGRYEGKNVSVRKMIRQALGVEDTQMSGAPDWVDTARYDIEAKTGETATLGGGPYRAEWELRCEAGMGREPGCGFGAAVVVRSD